MAKILLIETATEVCSAALAVDGQVVTLAEDLSQPNHAASLTVHIRTCMQVSGTALADLDAVAVSRGPGSYTSLRVGVSVAKGICYALDKPLLAVDTLQALAAASLQEFRLQNEGAAPLLVPMLDARRNEVWTAVFDARLQVILPTQALILDNNLFDFLASATPGNPGQNVRLLSGNGAKKISTEQIYENMVFSPIRNSSATHLAQLAEQFLQNADFQEVAYFEPFYMKPPNITTPNKALF